MDLRERALGLFDDHAAVERDLELLGEHLALPDRPFLQQADGGDVRERLDDADVGGMHPAGAGPEEVERTDDGGRSRIGKAWTEWKPAATARVRSSATARRWSGRH